MALFLILLLALGLGASSTLGYQQFSASAAALSLICRTEYERLPHVR